MEILRNVLLVLHIAGFAGIIGGVMMQMPKVKEGAAKINGAILHGSLLMLVTGLGLVGMFYASGNGDNAVSYTHLDVYKRQVRDIARGELPLTQSK